MFSLLKTLLLANSFWLAVAVPAPHNRAENSTCQFNLEPNTSDISNTSFVHMVKSVKLPSGRTYRYAFNPPFESTKPYLLFLHGFPESSYGWVNQIEYFTRHGYGVIVPDLLGYGGTDHPADLESYSLRSMVSELAELLDCEGLDKVVAVSHDFGSGLLSRMHTYEADRLSALAILDIGYFPPGTDLNQNWINNINNFTTASLGYPIFGYWNLNNRDDAHVLMDAHLDSMYTLMYTYNATYFRNHFAPDGAFEQWLLEDNMAPIGGEYLTSVTQEQWKTIVRAQGGLEAPLNWYKAFLRGINTADEQEIQSRSPAINQPVLLITADRDPVGVPSVQINNTVPFAQNIRVRSVDSGHFLQAVEARDVNAHLHNFFQSLE